MTKSSKMAFLISIQQHTNIFMILTNWLLNFFFLESNEKKWIWYETRTFKITVLWCQHFFTNSKYVDFESPPGLKAQLEWTLWPVCTGTSSIGAVPTYHGTRGMERLISHHLQLHWWSICKYLVDTYNLHQISNFFQLFLQ